MADDHPVGSLSRRDAMDRIVKIIGVATGLSVSQVKGLLYGQTVLTKSAPAQLDKKTILLKKTSNAQLKALKVLLENSRQVFENEYGRVTPIISRAVDNRRTNVCVTHFGIPDVNRTVGLGICRDTNTCTGQDLVGPEDPCEKTNDCNGQSCPSMYDCSSNKCENQECPRLVSCGDNQESIFSTGLLDSLRSDIYVQMLFREFNVNTTAALAQSIRTKILTQRLGRPR